MSRPAGAHTAGPCPRCFVEAVRPGRPMSVRGRDLVGYACDHCAKCVVSRIEEDLEVYDVVSVDLPDATLHGTSGRWRATASRCAVRSVRVVSGCCGSSAGELASTEASPCPCPTGPEHRKLGCSGGGQLSDLRHQAWSRDVLVPRRLRNSRWLPADSGHCSSALGSESWPNGSSFGCDLSTLRRWMPRSILRRRWLVLST